MDYSYVIAHPVHFSLLTKVSRLLLGIDEERKQIRCGLVDTIGSYTFAKTLEYKAKGLSGKEGKNITVVPPHEYQERFVSALDSYFVACPGACACGKWFALTGTYSFFNSDKWTKPVDETKLIHDPALLPSVL
jgi:1-phosphatidylinositol-3-phosphate 5-kinase